MKTIITIPKQFISALTSRPRSKQRFPKLTDNPKGAEENAEDRIAQQFQDENSNAYYKADDKAIEADKYNHDYLSLLVTDYFLKLAYL